MKTQINLIIAFALLFFVIPVSAQWTAATSGTIQDLNTAWNVDGNNILVGGTASTMLRSTDGATFSPVPIPGADDVNDIQFVNATLGYAAADNGRFLTTTNGGASWTTSFLSTSSNLLGVYFRDAMNGHVSGRDGVIFATTNGGVSWTAQSSGTLSRLEAPAFLDANTGYIAGRDDTWLSTTNGGTTWASTTLLGTGRDLNDLFFLDATTGWIASDNGVILKSTDGGLTWTQIFAGTAQNLNEVYFLDANVGYAVGDLGTIRKSTDGGLNWVAETSGTTADLEDVHFAADGSGVAVGTNGTILLMAAADPCGSAITGLSATVGATAVNFTWGNVATSGNYQIEGGLTGGATKRRIISTNALTVGIGFFTPGASYSWRVRAQCADGTISPWSALNTFTVPVLRKTITDAAPMVYPNPATSTLQIDFIEEQYNWALFDMTGRSLLQGEAIGSTSLDISSIAPGSYMLVTTSASSNSAQTILIN